MLIETSPADLPHALLELLDMIGDSVEQGRRLTARAAPPALPVVRNLAQLSLQKTIENIGELTRALASRLGRAARDAGVPWKPVRDFVADWDVERLQQAKSSVMHLIESGHAGHDRFTADDWDIHALLLLRKHPDWSNKRIAQELKIKPYALTRSPLFRRFAAEFRRNNKTSIREGFRKSGGEVDAATYDPALE